MRTCAKCGMKLTGASPAELCPACFLQEGLTPAEANAHTPGESSPPPSSPSPPLTRFGDYEILEEIAHGGMGVVYKARQLNLNRIVAVKMMLGGCWTGAAFVQRFRAEAEAVASLQHPHIIAVHEVGECEGRPFFSMDYVEGRNLADLTRDHPLPARQAATYLRTIAEAVHYAHEHGILHRDLKPSNILIDGFDEPRLADFGLAKRLTSDPQVADGKTPITLAGQVLGSPSYLSPEQAEGRHQEVGPPSDVYALGAVLYHLLTARPPFQAEKLTAVLQQVAQREPLAPRMLNPSVPRDLETICLKCLEKEKSKRYPTAQALAEDLNRFLKDEPIQARPVSAAGRLWRWCRRKPALAAALAACVTILALGLAGITWQWRRAVAGEREARLNLYAADMNVVQSALEDNNLNLAQALLDQHRPRKGEPDPRGWEWRYLWKQAQGDQVETVPVLLNGATRVEFSPDGAWFVTSGKSTNVVVRQWASKQIVATLPIPRTEDYPHDEPFDLLDLSPDAKFLAVAKADGIGIWETATWTLKRTLQGGVAPLAFSGDSRLLAARCEQVSKVRVWNTTTWVGELREAGFNSVYYLFSGLAFLPGSQRLIAFSTQGSGVRLVDLSSPDEAGTGGRPICLRTNSLGTTSSVSTLRVAISPRGDWLATGHLDGSVNFWTLPDGSDAGRLQSSSQRVCDLKFSPDGQTLAVSGMNDVIRLWDVATRTNRATLRGHLQRVSCLAFTPDGRQLLSSSWDDTCKTWDVTPTEDRRVLAMHRVRGHPQGICWFAEDGRTVITFTADLLPLRSVYERGVFLGEPRRVLTNLTHVTATSHDARTLRVNTATNATEIWDIYREERIGVLSTGLHVLCGHVVSPDNHLLYEAKVDEGPGRLWDLQSGQVVKTFPHRQSGTMGMAFSPDSRVLAVGITNHAVELWDTRAGRTLHILRGHRNRVDEFMFSADGRKLILSTWNGSSWIWDTVTGKNLLPYGKSLGGQRPWLIPGGQTVLTWGQEWIRLWNMATRREILKIDAGYYGLSPDGSTLALMEGDRLRLIYVPPLEEIDRAQ